MTRQRTLNESFTLEGKGLHTGLDIVITFLPAPENHGIKLKRIDLEEPVIIEALAENVTHTVRGTVLQKGDVQVSTVEHALAALYAFGIDNCLIEVNAPEFPILDGSARFYAEKIKEVGIIEQKAEKDFYVVRKKIEYSLPDSNSKITLLPDDVFSVDVHIGFDSAVLANQYASLDSLDKFADEIASARTFVFVHEIEPLLSMNLIKGGDLKNALVIYDKELSQDTMDRLTDKLHQPRIDATKLGYINGELNYPNEPARHKLLDVIGDLSLIGKPLKAKVIVQYPGHKINTNLAKIIRKEIKKQEVSAPVYDDSVPPVLDINAIRKLLPHRWPFLLVDKIIDINERVIVGVKNVSGNETFFMGHFPNEPVMPGVLLVEAMAQTAGILVLNKVEEPEKYSTYFMKIDNVKFRQKVVPGDTVIFRLEMMDEIRHGCTDMKGYAFVGGKIVAEAQFMAQIIKNK
ncbi:MAG TPA: bifunctional UDP-3-O-[3-hydroxymyristoyl] N-acetylglucosamine deacetylase/3-hydroxyacyl-ACP dehydratase [Paludibacteraceae bacterium]|jgi:UDP-3-O-[3-hydroxymyristoyl] N-acetylglucosamine deacetylase/3-hydroxyacyl-[acyl-carrier-protein] dehydratase|nr:bifunctional UDP-3-O-[3-hydroxymyristoyl] N-acetylglucosamine deacetylase/3-hydroxyacyl-ACP dehydratase [Paludibacteraceae bacterium]